MTLALLLAPSQVPDDNLGNLSCNFCSVPDAMLTLFRFSLGDINYSLFYHPSAHQAMKFLFISWAMISNILLLNLLIALMNSTYEQVMEEGEQIWRRLWARLVLLQERRLPNSLRIRYRLGEAIKGSDGNERHMHVTVESDQSKETNDDATRAALDEVKAMLLEQRSTEQRLRPRTAHLARKQQEQLPEAQAGMNNLELIQRTAVLWRRKASGKK